MSRGKLTERFEARPDAEAIFRRFVANANAVGQEPRTQRAPVPQVGPSIEAAEAPPPAVHEAAHEEATTASSVVFDSNVQGPVPSGHVVLLTKRKHVAVDIDSDDTQETPALTEEAARQVVETLDAGGRGGHVGRVVRLEDRRSSRPPAKASPREELVPDVARIAPPPPPVREKSEDGQIPAGELQRMLDDMAVLLRYGHHGEVRRRLEELMRRYPEDLLLMRRIAEFHLETDDQEAAIEMLFTLARRLFERRNVTGMRQALEQVLVLDPKHRRAYKLLGLLEARPDTGT